MIKDLMSLTLQELTAIIQGSTVKDSMNNNFNGGTNLLGTKQAVSRKPIVYNSEVFNIAGGGVVNTNIMGGDPGTTPVNTAAFYLGWFDHRFYSNAVAFTAGDLVVAFGITGPATAANVVYARRKLIPASMAAVNTEIFADFPPAIILFQTWRLTTNMVAASGNYDFNFRGIQISTN